MDAQTAARLREGVQELGFAADIAGPLERFGDALARWNRTYNLVSDASGEKILGSHLLDALAALAVLRQRPGPGPQLEEIRAVADCGSGPGLPGCIWAIAMPHWQVECLDSQYRPMAFLRAFRADAGLPNLHVRHGRIARGDDGLDGSYDLAVERAFLPPRQAVEAAGHLLRPGGFFAVLSSQGLLEGIGSWPQGFRQVLLAPVRIPHGPGGRALALLQKSNPPAQE